MKHYEIVYCVEKIDEIKAPSKKIALEKFIKKLYVYEKKEEQ